MRYVQMIIGYGHLTRLQTDVLTFDGLSSASWFPISGRQLEQYESWGISRVKIEQWDTVILP